jgi:hypothetical protein
MTEAQKAELLEILIQTWDRFISADDAFELIEDMMYAVQAQEKEA